MHGILFAGGKSLEYVIIGEPVSNRPMLVFLHEGLGSISMWKDFPERTANATGCRVLIYNRAGYGSSDPAETPRTPSFMHHEALVVLPEILQQQSPEDTVLVGHSDGASIALIFAGAYPEARISKLILLAPHVFVEDITVSSIAAAEREYLHGTLKSRLQRHHLRDVDHTFLEWAKIWLDPRFRDWNIEEYVPQVRVPILIIQGEQDEYGTLRQVEAIREKAGSVVKTLVLPDCKHSPHRDQPEMVLAAIREFLAQ